MTLTIRADGESPESVERLLRGLPEWFGIEASILEYVDASRTLPTTTVALDGEVVGACVVRHHTSVASEIEVLAVRRDLHRTGVGRRLLDHVEARLRADGVRLLQVKTRGPSAESQEYERTRAFYEALGYLPLEERTDIWGPKNPCLFMVKPLEPSP
jgi:ribosomal protein S18 acetylase RimI-like enzyme